MCHVLIIEDEPLIALDIQDLLERVGARSFAIAETQDEAVAAARMQRPDLITADVCLRQGTGPLAVEAITHEHGALPVIFITATPEVCRPCDQSARVLQKPVDPAVLIATYEDLAPPTARVVTA